MHIICSSLAERFPEYKLIFFFVRGITGVLVWEVFTCGKMPYGRLKNTEVVDRVQRGIILERPKACAKEIYEVSIEWEFFQIFIFRPTKITMVAIYLNR